MIKVSELLSKRLISLNSAQNIGTVSNIIFNSRLSAGKLLKVYNDDDDGAEVKYVELKKIKSFDFDAGVITDDAFVTNEWNTDLDGIINPINSECFNQDGKSLGFVRDIILDNSTVASILIRKESGEAKEFTPAQLLSYSSRLMIFNDTGKPIKLTKSKPSIPKKIDKPIEVKIHNDISPTPEQKTKHNSNFNEQTTKSNFHFNEQALKPNSNYNEQPAKSNFHFNEQTTKHTTHAAAPQTARPASHAVEQKAGIKAEKQSASTIPVINNLPQDVALPLKVPPSGTVISTPAPEGDSKTAYNFLLGKILAKDIKSNGKIIITENTVITNDIINIAKNEGKLVQLALHAE